MYCFLPYCKSYLQTKPRTYTMNSQYMDFYRNFRFAWHAMSIVIAYNAGWTKTQLVLNFKSIYFSRCQANERPRLYHPWYVHLLASTFNIQFVLVIRLNTLLIFAFKQIRRRLNFVSVVICIWCYMYIMHHISSLCIKKTINICSICTEKVFKGKNIISM